LLSLLRDGETPWDFEVLASRRSMALSEPFLAAWQNPVPYIDVLERGKWLPRGIRLCLREGIAIDRRCRPSISASDRFRRLRTFLVSSAIDRLPIGIRATIRRHRLQFA